MTFTSPIYGVALVAVLFSMFMLGLALGYMRGQKDGTDHEKTRICGIIKNHTYFPVNSSLAKVCYPVSAIDDIAYECGAKIKECIWEE
jgi:hypothetical protein